ASQLLPSWPGRLLRVVHHSQRALKIGGASQFTERIIIEAEDDVGVECQHGGEIAGKGIVIVFQWKRFDILKFPVAVGKVEYQGRVIAVEYRTCRLNLYRRAEIANGWHFGDGDEKATVNLFMVLERVVGPLASIHELLYRHFHVVKDPTIGSLNLGRIDVDNTVQFLRMHESRRKQQDQ